MVALVAIASHGGWEGDARLQFSGHDATRVARVFQELGGTDPGRTVVLDDPGPADLEGALERVAGWVAQAREAGRRSRVVLYYSGHADRRALHLGRASLDHTRLRQLVRTTAADQRVMILDACESGGIVEKGARVVPAFDVSLGGDAAAGEVVITSSTAGEASLESERLRGSFFTHHLVAGLRGAADAGDGLVSLTEAYDYAYRMTVADTGATRAGPQHPSYEVDLFGMGALVLTHPGKAAGVGWLRMPKTTAPWMILEHRNGPAVVSLPPQPDGGRLLALHPGRYWLRRRADSGLEVADVQVRAGETVAVGELTRASVPYAQVVRKGLVTRPGLAHSLSVSLSLGDSGLSEVGAMGGGDLRWRLERPGWAFGPVAGSRQARAQGEWVNFDHREASVGLSAGLVRDLGTSALWLGPEVRVVAQSQDFAESATDRGGGDRLAWTASYGAFATWELPVSGLWSLHLTGIAEVVRLDLLGSGAEHRLRGRAAVGLTWSLP